MSIQPTKEPELPGQFVALVVEACAESQAMRDWGELERLVVTGRTRRGQHKTCARFAEKRLVLLRAFTEAHRLNHAVTDDPDLALLDSLLRPPGRLVQNLQDCWTKGSSPS